MLTDPARDFYDELIDKIDAWLKQNNFGPDDIKRRLIRGDNHK